MIFRKVIAVLLMLGLASSLFGCAETSQNNDVSETTAQVTEETTVQIEEEVKLIEVKPDPPAVTASKRIIVSRDFARATFSASNGCELPYRLYIPADYDENYAYPVLLMLHGLGGVGTGNEIQIRSRALQGAFMDLDHEMYRCIVVAPQCPYDRWCGYNLGGYSIDDTPITEPMEAVIELLDYIDTNYSTHPGRKYVMGGSMGGFGTWDIITRCPDRFAAAIPMCGGGDSAYAEELKDEYIRIYHDVDDDTIPVIAARRMYKAIKAVGGERVEYIETRGYGHGIEGHVMNENDLSVYDWLFEKVRDGYITVEE